MAKTQMQAPSGAKSLLLQKKGPLPVWAWLIIGLAAVFIVTWWQRNRQVSTATESATSQPISVPGNQGAPPIFIVPQAATPAVNVPVTVTPGGPPYTRPVPRVPDGPVTVPTAPPGGGAEVPRLPAPPPPTAPIPLTESVPLETSIYDWLDQLNARYPGLSLDFGKLEMYNPGFRKYIRWDPGPAGAGYKIPVFNRDWSGRIPPLGIPPMRIRDF